MTLTVHNLFYFLKSHSTRYEQIPEDQAQSMGVEQGTKMCLSASSGDESPIFKDLKGNLIEVKLECGGT